jgi:hypothetical protein
MMTTNQTSARATPYHGRCQCGAVRYQVELDARSDGAMWGLSVWECVVAPERFTLLAGNERLSGLQFAAQQAHHFFCETCGVRSFSHHTDNPCGEFYTVDMRCLDRRQRHVA